MSQVTIHKVFKVNITVAESFNWTNSGSLNHALPVELYPPIEAHSAE